MKRQKKVDPEQELVEFIADCSNDPLLFVNRAFPWGEPNTELSTQTGPDDWQVGILTQIRDGLLTLDKAIQVAVASGHGVGKAQPVSLMVHTPSGLRRWGDLQVGDSLFGSDGHPTVIIQRHDHGVKPMFRVTFDDGSSTLCCGEHLWTVRGRNGRRTNSGWVTMSTDQIIKAGVTRSNGTAKAKCWELPQHEAVQFAHQFVPMDPYTLGVWLGDGGRKTARITTNDLEVIEQIQSAGYTTHIGSKSGTTAKAVTVHGIRQALRALGVLDKYSFEKYVPRVYLENTPAYRAELLRGLLDTDGEVSKSGTIIFSSTSYQLANDVVWLARSLGGKARISAKVKAPFYRDKSGNKVAGRPCWRATMSFPDGFSPFYIRRKLDRVVKYQRRYLSRWIASIEPAVPEVAMCVTVSAKDHLYLANDFIVTHNSALVSWLVLWAMSTYEDTKGVVTANTEVQLRTKTWPELAKWHRLFIAKHWFVFTATSLYSADPNHEKTWRVDAIAWSERNTEAFAGLHNQGKRIIVIFDEASAIPDIIFETTEGALTDSDTQIIWAIFGNPTRNTGRFRESFGRFKHRWITHQIDSRTAKLTNKAQIDQWIKDYGEDSDFVRIRVRGVFPRSGNSQFIPGDLVELAMAPGREEEVQTTWMDPLVLGVDCARFGDDQTVLCPRRGRDARSIPWRKFRGKDTMQIAALIAEMHNAMQFDAIFIDEGGLGAGVVDRCRMLRLPIVPVQFGTSPDLALDTSEGAVAYVNKGAEMWGRMRDWLKGGLLPKDVDLEQALTGREYGYVMRDGRDVIQLEKKQDMKKRGLASPDEADALCLTFAYPVQPSDHRNNLGRGQQGKHQVEYNPFSTAYTQSQAPTAGPRPPRNFMPHSNR